MAFVYLPQSVRRYLYSLIRLQMVLLIASMPILVAWGLPISPLSLIGNLIFAPFMVSFLALSLLWTLVFVCYGPCIYIQRLLDWILSGWLWVLSWGSPACLMSYPCPPAYVLGSVLMGLLLWLYGVRWKQVGEQVELLLLALMALFWHLLFSWYGTMAQLTMPVGQKNLFLVPSKGGVVLWDREGVLTKTVLTEKWIRYQLVPLISRAYGVRKCRACLIMKPTYERVAAAACFAGAGGLGDIVVPTSVTCQDARWERWGNELAKEGFSIVYLDNEQIGNEYLMNGR